MSEEKKWRFESPRNPKQRVIDAIKYAFAEMEEGLSDLGSEQIEVIEQRVTDSISAASGEPESELVVMGRRIFEEELYRLGWKHPSIYVALHDFSTCLKEYLDEAQGESTHEKE